MDVWLIILLIVVILLVVAAGIAMVQRNKRGRLLITETGRREKGNER